MDFDPCPSCAAETDADDYCPNCGYITPGSCFACGEPWCEEHQTHWADCSCPGEGDECPECGEWGVEEGWCEWCGKQVLSEPEPLLAILWAESDARLG